MGKRNTENPIFKYNSEKEKEGKPTLGQRLCKYCIVFTVILALLLIILFIVIFVVLPLVFKNSVEWQRSLVFRNYNITPSQAEFRNPGKYNIEGVENLYVTTNLGSRISLGIWHILPEPLLSKAFHERNYNYTQALLEGDYPVTLYLHESNGNRITPVDIYRILRKFFHVVAIDYRSYGDSSEGYLSEEDIVEDVVFIYNWLKRRTEADIFIWGHALGASIGAYTIEKLRGQNIVPTGIFLEAGFTNFREQFLASNKIVKFFSWMPWFNGTVLDPLEYNGFRFKTVEYIKNVNCPIMIFHAEDDSVVPYTMGKEIFKVAQESRNETIQGIASFHLYPSHFGYDHWRIHYSPDLPNYIKNHIDVCREFHQPVEKDNRNSLFLNRT